MRFLRRANADGADDIQLRLSAVVKPKLGSSGEHRTSLSEARACLELLSIAPLVRVTCIDARCKGRYVPSHSALARTTSANIASVDEESLRMDLRIWWRRPPRRRSTRCSTRGPSSRCASRASLPGGSRTSPGSSRGAGVPPRDQEEDESCRDLPGR